MFSSTASSDSTIPISKKLTLPVPSEILQNCSKDPKYYIPSQQFDEDWAFNLFANTATETEPPKKLLKEPKNICTKELQDNNEVVNKWIAQNLEKDERNLEDILYQRIEEENQLKYLNKKLRKQKSPWYIPNFNPNEDCPYIERSYCYPTIVADLGYQIVHYKTLIDYARSGIKLFQIDLRFGTENMHAKAMEHIQHARKILSKQGFSEGLLATMFLITERKMRTGINHHHKPIFLERDSIVILTADRHFSHKSTHEVIYINFTEYTQRIKPDDIIQIGDKIKLKVIRTVKISLECIVIFEGLLINQSPVKIPIERTLERPPRVTTEEEHDILRAFKLGCDFLIIPLPYSLHLITYIHWEIAAEHHIVKILAKIDLNDIDTINEGIIDFAMEYCIGIWLCNIKFDKITPILQYIIKTCFRHQKILIWAGVFNECIENIFIPQDEELRKIMFLYPTAFVVRPDAVDLTKLKTFIRISYPEMNQMNLKLSCNPIEKFTLSIENIFTRYLILAALKNRVSCIIVSNNSGKSVTLISKYRPLVPIIASFCDIETSRRRLLLRNVYPIPFNNQIALPWNEELDLRLAFCVEYGKQIGCIIRDKPFIFCFDSKRGIKYSDSYRILTLDDVTFN